MIKYDFGAFEDLVPEIEDNSVDLIFTDPPYARALATNCYESLAYHAPRILKRGGSLVTIVPHYLLGETMQIINTLKYRWIYCMNQVTGPHPRMAMGIEILWKPMLHYVKEAYPQGRGFLRDMVIIPSPDKSLHEWQQSLAWCEYYIEKLTKPGDLVLDPFCGPATSLIASSNLGRRSIGFEYDKDIFETGVERITSQ